MSKLTSLPVFTGLSFALMMALFAGIGHWEKSHETEQVALPYCVEGVDSLATCGGILGLDSASAQKASELMYREKLEHDLGKKPENIEWSTEWDTGYGSSLLGRNYLFLENDELRRYFKNDSYSQEALVSAYLTVRYPVAVDGKSVTTKETEDGRKWVYGERVQ